MGATANLTIGRTAPLSRALWLAEEATVLFAFVLSNIRVMVCYREAISRPASCTYLSAWEEMQAWALLFAFTTMIMWRRRQLGSAATVLRRNWPIVLFIGLAAASLGWTINPPATIYRLAILIGSTWLGVCLALTHTLRGILQRIAVYGAVVIFASLVAGLLFPGAGISDPELYGDAWRGAYWHRNYLGSSMALFAMVHLFRLLGNGHNRASEVVMDALGWVLACALVVLSRSITGVILLVSLHAATILCAAWVRWHSSMRLAHYAAIAIVILAAAGALLTNIDAVLAAVGRESSIVWRRTLWTYLYEERIQENALLGNGFGAIWETDSFGYRIAEEHGWRYPVYMSDSGYIDTALHLGFVGLAVAALTVGFGAARAIAVLRAEKSILSAFPLVVTVYFLLTNVTLSYLLELESFAWVLLVTALCAADVPAWESRTRAA